MSKQKEKKVCNNCKHCNSNNKTHCTCDVNNVYLTSFDITVHWCNHWSRKGDKDGR